MLRKYRAHSFNFTSGNTRFHAQNTDDKRAQRVIMALGFRFARRVMSVCPYNPSLCPSGQRATNWAGETRRTMRQRARAKTPPRHGADSERVRPLARARCVVVETIEHSVELGQCVGGGGWHILQVNQRADR